jgi:signal transduction histidine kinase
MTPDQLKVSPRTPSNSVLLASDFDSFKQQESIFIILNLFILAALQLLHTVFSSYWGLPSRALIAILSGGLLAQGTELFWLLGRSRPLGFRGMALLTWYSIFFNICLAGLLQYATSREDAEYFVIMVVPILVAAFRLNLLPTVGVVAVVDCINFLWVWHYARSLRETPVGEYMEAGTMSLVDTVVGVLVWLMVKNLRQKEARLSQSLADLREAEERLRQEEKLAAVGRLSSAIAHEVRNPVSTIVSALATVRRGALSPAEREEMLGIAVKESRRLEGLTTDFLAYARPRSPQMISSSLDDTLGYVADSCRPRAGEGGVSIQANPSGVVAEFDATDIQQALTNLVMNAVEASLPAGTVNLRATAKSEGCVQIEVENAGPGIPLASVARIFEPFFTTKPQGTGLGLAIARNIARAHGGDLTLSVNRPGRVCFALTIPIARAK